MLVRRFGTLALACQLTVVAALWPAPYNVFATGRIAGGINAEPSIRPTVYLGPNPDGWWCQSSDCVQSADPNTTINQELSLAADLHVVNVRVEFPWALMEPQKDVFDWSRADVIVAAARAHRVTLQPVLMWTPGWESTDISQVTSADDLASFVKAFIKRYDHAFPVVEMWNEPDGGAYGSYTNGREQVYVDTILNPGYAAVKSADRSIAVELGGSINDSGGCCPFLKAVLANGGTFDIAAFHNYVGATSAIAEAAEYRATLDQSGRTATPIWMGEYGVQDANSMDAQQQLLMQDILGGNNDLAMAQWYNLRDDFAMSCCPPAVAVAAHWGLVQHDDCTVKAGYATMARLLGGASAIPGCNESAAAGAASRASPSATPARPGRIAATSHQAGVPPWPVAVAAVAIALVLVVVLFALRYRRRRVIRTTPTRRPPDDGW